MKHYELLIMAPIFVVLLLAIHEPVKAAFNFGSMGAWVFSVCISTLAMINMNHCFKDSIEVILLAYAAMAIAILAVLFFVFIGKITSRAKEILFDQFDKKDRPVGNKNTDVRFHQKIKNSIGYKRKPLINPQWTRHLKLLKKSIINCKRP